MSELRRDRTTGALVIIAPQRRRRPTDVPLQVRAADSLPAYDPNCPFCPGHEAELPGIVAESLSKDLSSWSVRAVPNKFPAIAPGYPICPNDSRHEMDTINGLHEVVIESPQHNADLATMPAGELQAVAAMYRQRCAALLNEPRIETAVLFRNRGAASGTSLMHPHAQIIALDLVPPRLAAIDKVGLDYFRKRGRCAACDDLDFELQTQKRIVDETEHFAALVPYAAEHPYELLLMPKRHCASFTAIDDVELLDFAGLLGRSLRRIDVSLSHPPYNFALDSAPKSAVGAPHLHWRLRIVPKIVTWGGFELGSAMAINPSLPENDAAVLRAAM